MSDAKHTPGKWEWDEPSNWHGMSARVMVREPYGLIATVQLSGWKPKSMAIANARLIAAAPALLAACKLALERLDRLGASDYQPVYLDAHPALVSAIAKAEGRS